MNSRLIYIDKALFAQLREEMSWYESLPKSLTHVVGDDLHINMFEHMYTKIASIPDLNIDCTNYFLAETPSMHNDHIVVLIGEHSANEAPHTTTVVLAPKE